MTTQAFLKRTGQGLALGAGVAAIGYAGRCVQPGAPA